MIIGLDLSLRGAAGVAIPWPWDGSDWSGVHRQRWGLALTCDAPLLDVAHRLDRLAAAIVRWCWTRASIGIALEAVPTHGAHGIVPLAQGEERSVATFPLIEASDPDLTCIACGLPRVELLVEVLGNGRRAWCGLHERCLRHHEERMSEASGCSPPRASQGEETP